MQLFGILRELRESRRFSQKTLAARLGCSPSRVSAYETGERQPSRAMLVARADIYRVPTDYLLGRRGANPELDLAGLSQQEIEALRVIVEAMRRD